MTPEQVTRAAEYFARARREAARFDTLPPDCRLPDIDSGYAVQEALHDTLGVPVIGYKIGCTTEVMQKFLKIAHPCGGSIQETGVHPSSAALQHDQFRRVGVECEIAVRLGRDLPADEAPFDRDMVADAVASCMAAIEIVDDRYADYSKLDAQTLIADDFFGAGCVLGEPRSDWQSLDLAAITAAMSINGVEVGNGAGSHVMGHPFEALAWLATTLAKRGRGLERDRIVLTGSIVETQWVDASDIVSVLVEGLGTAEVRFT